MESFSGIRPEYIVDYRTLLDRKEVDAKTKTFDKLVLDRSDSLDRWANLLREMLEQVGRIYTFANNHYAGHGPATIRQLVDLLPAEMT